MLFKDLYEEYSASNAYDSEKEVDSFFGMSTYEDPPITSILQDDITDEMIGAKNVIEELDLFTPLERHDMLSDLSDDESVQLSIYDDDDESVQLSIYDDTDEENTVENEKVQIVDENRAVQRVIEDEKGQVVDESSQPFDDAVSDSKPNLFSPGHIIP